MRLAAHGLSIRLPDGWEGRIYRRPGGAAVLHVASFPLQGQDGDFGARATARMGSDDVFAALLEYRPGGMLRPNEGLFAGGIQLPGAPQFGPRQLQVARPGQLGWQRFFTEAGRPFCLYAVIRPVRRARPRLVSELNAVLGTLRIERLREPVRSPSA